MDRDGRKLNTAEVHVTAANEPVEANAGNVEPSATSATNSLLTSDANSWVLDPKAEHAISDIQVGRDLSMGDVVSKQGVLFWMQCVRIQSAGFCCLDALPRVYLRSKVRRNGRLRSNVIFLSWHLTRT
jgi:hypothetical protein